MSDLSFSQNLNWSVSKKITFQFFFIFIALFIIFNNNGAFIFLQPFISYPNHLLRQFIPWFSANVLKYNYDFTIFPNGSGDTSYNYVSILFFFILSLFGSILWFALDRKRKSYTKLYYWLIVFVRFYVAFMLILYGSIKVIKLQFPDPSLTRLLQPFGEASPMGLAWTFLGFSKGYNIFMGIIEISSIFLLFRKTMVAGAFLSLAASVHVMAMNYFYDVPVKILSTALVFLCLFILAPYFITIFRFFFSNTPQQLVTPQPPVFKKKWQNLTVSAVKYLVIILTVGFMLNNAWSSQYQYGTLAPKPALYGIYNVETYSLNGKEKPPLLTDNTRWKQLIIENSEFVRVKLMNDSSLFFNLILEPKTKKIKMESKTSIQTEFKFQYKLEHDQLILVGSKNLDSLSVTLKKYDLKNFKLINRGFHWINEHPYNH
ncbi:hypothetical protein [Pedobacter nototheniae]|uniref:hypothetical protein n=1 Tax=Pedobacter nototheniae TaxID=2488994 RepID=UPI00292F5F52|nr:hypothetical protein [Pedobacter nototheniae]